MSSFRSGSAGGRMGSRGWTALALLLLPLTAGAGPNSQYRWDESNNRPGPSRCRTDSQCDGARTCSPAGWCQGDARPVPPPPPPPPPRPDWDRGPGRDRGPDWERGPDRGDFRTDRPTFIRSQLDGLVLDVAGNNRAAGADVIGYPAKHRRDGIDNQQWELVPTRGGYYIRSRLNGYVLDVWGLNRNVGAPVKLSAANGGANQLWKIVPSHVRGYYFIESALNGYVLDIDGARREGRLIVHPRKRSGTENQLWQFDR
ncbi:MAG: RICIN domain-containing protein [Cystobacter sp.]